MYEPKKPNYLKWTSILSVLTVIYSYFVYRRQNTTQSQNTNNGNNVPQSDPVRRFIDTVVIVFGILTISTIYSFVEPFVNVIKNFDVTIHSSTILPTVSIILIMIGLFAITPYKTKIKIPVGYKLVYTFNLSFFRNKELRRILRFHPDYPKVWTVFCNFDQEWNPIDINFVFLKRPGSSNKIPSSTLSKILSQIEGIDIYLPDDFTIPYNQLYQIPDTSLYLIHTKNCLYVLTSEWTANEMIHVLTDKKYPSIKIKINISKHTNTLFTSRNGAERITFEHEKQNILDKIQMLVYNLYGECE